MDKKVEGTYVDVKMKYIKTVKGTSGQTYFEMNGGKGKPSVYLPSKTHKLSKDKVVSEFVAADEE